MTLRIISGTPNRETRNAELFRDALLASEPRLDHPDIVADILCGLPLPEREIDLVLLYYDPRRQDLQIKTPKGLPIHSFVLVVEVKHHSTDLIRFDGSKLLVRYDRFWKNATEQCDKQTYALQRYQLANYRGTKFRKKTFVQRAIWLPRADLSAFDGIPNESNVPVHFASLDWNNLVGDFRPNRGSIRSLMDHADDPSYHNIDTMRELLTRKVSPTKLDLRRINALTQTRFDVEKTAYIQNLGQGLLILRGRGGTGKTFALVQIALHLAKLEKRTVILTYNHGLISDLKRIFQIIESKDHRLTFPPELMTRYSFIQSVYEENIGLDAEASVREIPDIGAREKRRIADLLSCKTDVKTNYEFVLVDEGQDWEDNQRDLLYRLVGAKNIIIADGVDQYVSQDRCKWDIDNIPINRRHRLRASHRTKSATCQTIAEIAKFLGVTDWDLIPVPEAHGGRFTVLVEPQARLAVKTALAILDEDQRQDRNIKAVDNLVCIPSPKIANGINFAALFDKEVNDQDRDSWRGFSEGARRIFPTREAQLRAIQYNSCRGMEGWSTICLGLDLFFEYQAKHPRIDIENLERDIQKNGNSLFSKQLLEDTIGREQRRFAINWLMIPLTRSIDHLVVHLTDEQSELGKILSAVSDRMPGAIEWIRA